MFKKFVQDLYQMAKRRRSNVKSPQMPKRSKTSGLGDPAFYVDENDHEEMLIGETVELSSSSPQPSTSKRTARDKFCWLCHKNGTTHFCSTCIRSFHANCLKKGTEKRVPDNWRCMQCFELKNAKNDFKRRNVNIQLLNELLKFTVTRLFQDDEFKDFKDFSIYASSSTNQDVVNPMDLSVIEEKVDDSKYESTMEFFLDIKWILHNCFIAFSQNEQIINRSKRMQRFCEKELYDIEVCSECYRNSNEKSNWFVNACQKPHLMVWAKMKGHPYWPAKAIAMKNYSVDVRFFGDHEGAFLPIENVLLYSSANPNKTLTVHNQKWLEECTPEVDQYIRNLRSKFGVFKYATLNKPFDVDMVYLDLQRMLPYLVFDNNGEYFRKMKDFIRREKVQPQNTSKPLPFGIKDLRILVERISFPETINDNLMKKTLDDDNESDARSDHTFVTVSNGFLDSSESISSIEASMSIHTKFSEIIEENAAESDVSSVASDFKCSNDAETSANAQETEKTEENNFNIPIVVLSQNTEAADSDGTMENPLNSSQESAPNVVYSQESTKTNGKEPPPTSMPVIDDTEVDESSEDPLMPINESDASSSNENAIIRSINMVRYEKKQLKLETERLQNELNNLETENQNWKDSFVQLEKTTKTEIAKLKKQLMDKEKSFIEYKMEMELQNVETLKEMKKTIEEEMKSKSWCLFCGKETHVKLPYMNFCNVKCVRQAWLRINQSTAQTDVANGDSSTIE